MALVRCPECNREISDRALTCPQCGCPIAAHRLPTAMDSSARVRSARITNDLISMKVLAIIGVSLSFLIICFNALRGYSPNTVTMYLTLFPIVLIPILGAALSRLLPISSKLLAFVWGWVCTIISGACIIVITQIIGEFNSPGPSGAGLRTDLALFAVIYTIIIGLILVGPTRAFLMMPPPRRRPL
jgi:hypothetical protein